MVNSGIGWCAGSRVLLSRKEIAGKRATLGGVCCGAHRDRRLLRNTEVWRGFPTSAPSLLALCRGTFPFSFDSFLLFVCFSLNFFFSFLFFFPFSSFHFYFFFFLCEQGAAVSLPLIGYNIANREVPQDVVSLMLPPAVIVGGFLARTLLNIKMYDTVLAALGLGAIFVTGSLSQDYTCLLGGLGVVVFSLVIGTEGSLLGMRRVDVFHYGFAAAISALSSSLIS